MSKKIFHKVGTVALVAAMAVPFAANAESNFNSTTGTGNLTARAQVDFQITIPKFLFLRVGSLGTNNVNLFTFDVPAADVGNSAAPVLGTGGENNTGVVNAVVRGNGGDVRLTAATDGALSNGSGDSINWTDITTIVASGTFTPPQLSNGSTNATVSASGKVVDQTATWRYSYANSAVVPAGTYGGTGINNGRVTYTATFL